MLHPRGGAPEDGRPEQYPRGDLAHDEWQLDATRELSEQPRRREEHREREQKDEHGLLVHEQSVRDPHEYGESGQDGDGGPSRINDTVRVRSPGRNGLGKKCVPGPRGSERWSALSVYPEM